MINKNRFIYEVCGWNIRCSQNGTEELSIAFSEGSYPLALRLIADGKTFGKIFRKPLEVENPVTDVRTTDTVPTTGEPITDAM